MTQTLAALEITGYCLAETGSEEAWKARAIRAGGRWTGCLLSHVWPPSQLPGAQMRQEASFLEVQGEGAAKKEEASAGRAGWDRLPATATEPGPSGSRTRASVKGSLCPLLCCGFHLCPTCSPSSLTGVGYALLREAQEHSDQLMPSAAASQPGPGVPPSCPPLLIPHNPSLCHSDWDSFAPCSALRCLPRGCS